MSTTLDVMDTFNCSNPDVQDIMNLSPDLILMSLDYLSLGNLIVIRRVNGYLRSVVDLLLIRRRRISKNDMGDISFDDREWLLKDMKLPNIERVALVSIELNEELARHLGRFSPILKTICVDGTCYNRCYEFVDTYMTTYAQYHPNKWPCLQVDNLIEIDEDIQRLLSKFTKWSVNLRIPSSNLNNWRKYWKYVHTVVVSRVEVQVDSFKLTSTERDVKCSYPNLHTLVFDSVDLDYCLIFRPFIEMVEEIIFENLSIRDHYVLLVLNDTKLKGLQINLNHHKGKQLRLLFIEMLTEYLTKNGICLKFLKVTTSHRDDSIQLIKTVINLGFKNLEFEIGNPTYQFSYLKRKLTIYYWIDMLSELFTAFPKAKEVKIVTRPSFNVLGWIGEAKSFAAEHRNRCLNFSVSIEGIPENGQVITINGSNYKLTIPKVAGCSFNLTSNNVLFAFSLAEMSQMTDLRNQALTFMKHSIGPDLCNRSSSREICDLFKNIAKE